MGVLKLKALFRSKTWKEEFNCPFFYFYVFILLVEKLVRKQIKGILGIKIEESNRRSPLNNNSINKNKN